MGSLCAEVPRSELPNHSRDEIRVPGGKSWLTGHAQLRTAAINDLMLRGQQHTFFVLSSSAVPANSAYYVCFRILAVASGALGLMRRGRLETPPRLINILHRPPALPGARCAH